jgi:hypothetical protein
VLVGVMLAGVMLAGLNPAAGVAVTAGRDAGAVRAPPVPGAWRNDGTIAAGRRSGGTNRGGPTGKVGSGAAAGPVPPGTIPVGIALGGVTGGKPVLGAGGAWAWVAGDVLNVAAMATAATATARVVMILSRFTTAS